jgi:hypothetical protein
MAASLLHPGDFGSGNHYLAYLAIGKLKDFVQHLRLVLLYHPFTFAYTYY